MPGTKGNRNAVKHGVYGFLAIGSLPKGASYIRKQLGQMERALRQCVADDCGEISVYKASLIQTATRHEGRAQLLTRWLRESDGEIKTMDKVAILREIGAASDSRDKCLKQLNLDRDERMDAIDALYATPAADTHDRTPDVAQDATDGPEATDKTPEPDDGLESISRNVEETDDD